MHSGFFANQGAVATVEPDGGKEGTGGSGGGDGGGAGDGELNIRKKKKVRRREGRDAISRKPLCCSDDMRLPSRRGFLLVSRLIETCVTGRRWCCMARLATEAGMGSGLILFFSSSCKPHVWKTLWGFHVILPRGVHPFCCNCECLFVYVRRRFNKKAQDQFDE